MPYSHLPLLFPKVKRFGSFSLRGEGWDEGNFIGATFLIPPQSAIRPAGEGVLFLNSTLSGYTQVGHTPGAGIQCHGWEA